MPITTFSFDGAKQLAVKLMRDSKSPSVQFAFGDKTTSLSRDAANAALVEQMKMIAGSPRLYRENKNTVFRLIEETLTEVLPKNIIDTYGQFADTRTVAQGDTYTFTRKLGRQRAKQFVTRVGLAGRYEAFELADEKFTMQTTAYGGAARIGLEEFLDGRVQWADYLDIVNEGMSEAVYKEIAKALRVAIDQFPDTNKVSAANFDEAQFDRLLATVSIYGAPCIYCTMEAALTLLPSNEWVSDDMKTERWQNGHFARYKGVPIVILPQSFVDETNKEKVMDPSFIYIFPTNAGAKPITIVFEGSTLVKDFDNRDWSTEMQTYQKFGVALHATNNLAVYRNKGLTIDNIPGEWSWD